MKVGLKFRASGVLTPIYAVVANATVTDSVYCPEQNRAALTTKFSASEAASAMEYMAMAGWKMGDMLNGIEGIMNLAAASGEDLATTSIAAIAFTLFTIQIAEHVGHIRWLEFCRRCLLHLGG